MRSIGSDVALGVMALLVILMAVAIGGLAVWGLSAHAAPRPLPPMPAPSPDDDHAGWYEPVPMALRQLPRAPADGFDRDGQRWRWEINRRGEYRFHRCDRPGSMPAIGYAPPTSVGAKPKAPMKRKE
jgi:hypothetical protein